MWIEMIKGVAENTANGWHWSLLGVGSAYLVGQVLILYTATTYHLYNCAQWNQRSNGKVNN